MNWHLLEVGIGGRHFLACPVGRFDRGSLLGGAASAPQDDRQPACLSVFLPACLIPFSSFSRFILLLFISEIGTREKLDNFILIMIIHISRIENSQIKILAVTIKIKQLYLTSPEAN